MTLTPAEITVGMGATRASGSDRYPYTVVSVNGNTVGVIDDDAKVVSGSIADGSAEWEITPVADPENHYVTYFRYRPSTGRWNEMREDVSGKLFKVGPGRISFGHRRRYYDPHF